MTGPTNNRIEHLFSQALERTASERRVLLDRECAAQSALRARVEALLAAHDRAGGFLETLPVVFDDCLATTLEIAVDNADQRFEHTPGRIEFLEPPQHPDELGRFDGYAITEILGRGGAGIVLKAVDPTLNRTVALKVLAPEWANQPRARKRFLREARAAAAVEHRNVVAIHAIGEANGLPYLVMEWVPGPSLQDLLTSGPIALAEVVRISHEVASGLAAAHACRLVHRDVKPANVLLEQGQRTVKLTDFGLARTVDDTGITQEGMIAGTPQYMSPEQATGDAIDFRSDLFSLGSVMYALCTGRAPFVAESSLASMKKICDETPTPISKLRPDVFPDLAALIGSLLEKQPSKRPPDAKTVVEQLSDVRLHQRRFPRLGRRELMAGGLVVVAGCAAAAVFRPWSTDTPDSREAPPEPPKNAPPQTHTERAKRNARYFDESVAAFAEIRRMAVQEASPVKQRLYGLTVSHDGDRIYASCANRLIYCWDSRNGEEVMRFRGPDVMSMNILVSPDGKRLITCDSDRTIRLRDTDTGRIITRIPLKNPIRHAALSPDGAELLVALGGIRPRRRRPGQPLPPAPVAGRLEVFETKTGQNTRSLAPPKPGWFSFVAWSPDGKQLAASSATGRVLLFDNNGTFIRQMTASGTPGDAHEVHYSDDGARLYAAGSGNWLRCWSLPQGDERFSRLIPQNGPVRFAVDETERWLAMGGASEVRLWDLADKRDSRIRNLAGHTSTAHRVAFLPRADVLVSCGWDGTVRLWRLPGPRAASTKHKAVFHRLRPVDGFIADSNADGTFDNVDTRSASLRIAPPSDGSAGEFAVMEFDASSIEGELVDATVTFRVTLLNTSNRAPSCDLDIHAYSADGVVSRQDARRKAVLVAKVRGLGRKDLRIHRIPLDVKALRPLLARKAQIGLRVSSSSGHRVLLASTTTVLSNSAPTLNLQVQPRVAPTRNQ